MPGNSGSIPLPDYVKELKGTLVQCRVRPRLRAVPLDDELRPPKYLEDAERKQWWVFVNQFKEMGLVDSMNVPAINMLSRAHVYIRANLEMNLTPLEMNCYFVLLSAFGGWPKARGNYRPLPILDD